MNRMKNLKVSYKVVSIESAKNSNALYLSNKTYPDKVRVYTIGNSNLVFSKEICSGPHVTSTNEIGEFKIIKQASAGSGVWRIYDVIIEGVSIVSNYRGQFNSIMSKESFEGLMKRLREKGEDIIDVN